MPTETPAKAVDRSGDRPFARVKRVSFGLLETCGLPWAVASRVAHYKCRARSSLMRTTAQLVWERLCNQGAQSGKESFEGRRLATRRGRTAESLGGCRAPAGKISDDQLADAGGM